MLPPFGSVSRQTVCIGTIDSKFILFSLNNLCVQLQPFSSTARGATGPRYQDRVVVVTGGSKGIGEGIVRVFCKD